MRANRHCKCENFQISEDEARRHDEEDEDEEVRIDELRSSSLSRRSNMENDSCQWKSRSREKLRGFELDPKWTSGGFRGKFRETREARESREEAREAGERTERRESASGDPKEACQQHEAMMSISSTSQQEGSKRLLARPYGRPICERVALLSVVLFTLLMSPVSMGTQKFEAQPDSQVPVASGQDVRLRCLVRNRQGECLWLRNGRAVGTIQRKYQFSRQPEDGDCSLTIRNVSVQQDDGIWQCQVTASDLEQDTLQSSESQLVVLVSPERPQIKNLVSRARQ